MVVVFVGSGELVLEGVEVAGMVFYVSVFYGDMVVFVVEVVVVLAAFVFEVEEVEFDVVALAFFGEELLGVVVDVSEEVLVALDFEIWLDLFSSNGSSNFVEKSVSFDS